MLLMSYSASRMHFTTLDDFLSQRTKHECLKDEEQTENKLIGEIGDGLANLLWDLFTHVEGPRIRHVPIINNTNFPFIDIDQFICFQ